ncbi:MAG: alkyl hydroperoxide reductase, partial [Akkermansiaceae bacterium]|nr:alkyl hydroperoxide reductase [Akkermansiaceae bacterium]
VPGQTGIRFPEGLGKKLPAGAWLKFQVHYTPNGEKATDRSEIGFVFADEPIHTEVRTSSAINADF